MTLNDVKHRLNLYRRRRYWHAQKAIFIHVPKVAGTSINHAVYGRTLGHYSALEIRRAFPRLYQDAFTFAFVRDPWERVYSAYCFAKKGQTESMGIHNPEQYQIPEFETFESFVFDWLDKKNIADLDFVFQPQHAFVCDSDGQVMVDFLGRLENIDTDMQEVAKLLGRPISVNTKNSSGSKQRLKSQISPAIREKIAGIYRQDIEIFGYGS